MIPLNDDNPTTTFPFVTISIVAINIVVFFYQLSLDNIAERVFILKAAAIPYEISRFTDIFPRDYVPPPLTIITSTFVHGGFLHLAMNMLFLWIFGDNIEDRIGHVKFLLFYLLMGAAAGLTHVAADASSPVPMIGASGAGAGVLGAYFLLFPHAHVRTLFIFIYFVRIVKVPAIVFLGIWFAIQVLSAGNGGGIAWYAHIGGFLAGVFFTAMVIMRRPRWPRR